jgi:hypothetical protein
MISVTRGVTEGLLCILQPPYQIYNRHSRHVEECLDRDHGLLEARRQGVKASS